MTQLVLIADDVTGALDSAAPFAMRGLSTVVALAPAALPEALARGADIVGVATNSREIAADAAHAAVRTCLRHVPPGVRLFKKVDSRLKGNVAAELDAIPHERALVIPAIPAFGRWVRNGMLGGLGIAEPIAVAARLGAQAARAVIADAATQADIELALAATTHDLPVGARGLAEALAQQLAPQAVVPDTRVGATTAICLIGSTDPITLTQVERLRAAMPQLRYIAAPGGEAPPTLPAPAALTVVQALPGDTAAEQTIVAQRLGELLVRLAPAPDTLLVLSGGATAQAALAQLGVEVLELSGEALPGLPIARAGGFTLITKSGGFGEPDTLLQLLGGPDTRQEGDVGWS